MSETVARAASVMQRLADYAGVAVHSGEALLDQLVTHAEDIAHRLETSTVPGDFALLKTEGVKVAAMIGLILSAKPPSLTQPAPEPAAEAKAET